MALRYVSALHLETTCVVTYFLFNGKFICTLTMLFLRQHNVAILDCWKLQLTNHIVM